MRSLISKFLRLEAAGGMILIVATVAALVMANSPLDRAYVNFLHAHLVIDVYGARIPLTFLDVVNEGLMPIFFLIVGLEIKRELLEGELSNWATAVLPVVCAIGGMLLPALTYLGVNSGDGESLRGWAIPSATDIAFAVSVLTLLGRRVPESLKVFLLALAIIDDLGAIVIIAVFYTSDLSFLYLFLAFLAMSALCALNVRGVRHLFPYLLIGIVLWLSVLNSGVHATLAGVALAFAIPLRGPQNNDEKAPLLRLEKTIHPWASYMILPLFGFANAGVSLHSFDLTNILQPIPLGIALGLFLGKQFGVAIFGFLAVRGGLARLPAGATWPQFYGTAIITGIGFTMSLFIGTLAFSDGDNMIGVKIGVIVGSLLSAVCGFALLSFTAERHEH